MTIYSLDVLFFLFVPSKCPSFHGITTGYLTGLAWPNPVSSPQGSLKERLCTPQCSWVARREGVCVQRRQWEWSRGATESARIWSRTREEKLGEDEVTFSRYLEKDICRAAPQQKGKTRSRQPELGLVEKQSTSEEELLRVKLPSPWEH